jgi:hypothetical protein
MTLPLLELLEEKKRAGPLLAAIGVSLGDRTLGRLVVAEAGEALLDVAERGRELPSGGVTTTMRYSGEGGGCFSLDDEDESSFETSFVGVSGRIGGVPTLGVEELFKELLLPFLWCCNPSMP